MIVHDGLYTFRLRSDVQRPGDFAEVVRTHHWKAQGLLYAQGPASRRVQAGYVKAIGADRNLVRVDDDALAALAPKGSWAMAAIIDGATDLGPLAAWARKRARDADERIRFYLLPSAKPVRVFAPWYAAGFDDPRTMDARDWRTLHPSFGLFFANVVYVDAKVHPEWFR